VTGHICGELNRTSEVEGNDVLSVSIMLQLLSRHRHVLLDALQTAAQ